jgi:hypothetical protein
VGRLAASARPEAQDLASVLRGYDASNLESLIDNAASHGLTTDSAARFVQNVQGKAAESYFFQEAAQAGVDLTPVKRTYVPSGNPTQDLALMIDQGFPSKQLASIPQPPEALPAEIKGWLADGTLRSKAITEDGVPSTLLFKPRQEGIALRLERKTQLLNAITRPIELQAKIDAATGLTKTALTSLKTEANAMGSTGEAVLRRQIGELYGYSDDAIKQHLLDRGLQDVVTGKEKWARFLEELPTTVVDDGLKALYQKGLREPGGLTFYKPWDSSWQTVKWDTLLGFTGFGQAKALAGSGLLSQPMGTALAKGLGQVEEWTKAGFGWAKNRFLDHFSPTEGVNASIEEPARRTVYSRMKDYTYDRDQGERWAKTFLPEERKAMFRALDETDETYQARVGAIMGPTGGKFRDLAEKQGIAQQLAGMALSKEDRDLARVLANTPSPRVFDEALSSASPFLRDAYERLARKKIGAELDADMMGRLHAAMPNKAADVTEAIKTWRKNLGQIPTYMKFTAKWEQDLKRFSPEARSAWATATEDPFYVPHQMSKRLRELLDEGMIDTNKAGKIQSVFDQARTYPNRSSFLEALKGVADQVGLAPETMEDVADELMDEDFASLYVKRMGAFRITQTRQEIYQLAAQSMAKHGGSTSDYQFYVNRVLHPVHELDWATGELKPGGSSRRNIIGKVLGGGEFTVPMQSQATAEKWLGPDGTVGLLKEMGGKVVQGSNGKWGLTFRWPGLSIMYKPALTSIPINVKFRVRNLIQGPAMMTFDPSFGELGAQAVWDGVRHGPVLRELLLGQPKRAWTGPLTPYSIEEMEKAPQAVTATRMVLGDTEAERSAAQNVLKAQGWRHGPYSADQVADAMRLIKVGSPLSPADLGSGQELIRTVSEAASGITPATRGDPTMAVRAVRALAKWIKHGEDLSAHTEATLRTAAMLALLRRGEDPVQAAYKIGRAFVDYSRQSTVERFARDFFPFARFMIASTAWVKPILENPRLINTLAYSQRALQPTGQEQALLPTEAQESLALPLPWKDEEGNYEFITSLGLPHEAAMQMLGAVASEDAARKYVLGAINPAPALPHGEDPRAHLLPQHRLRLLPARAELPP